MRSRKLLGFCVGLLLVAPGFARDKGIDPALLAMQDCPNVAGCPALVLLDETELNNELNRSRYSTRRLIKVFTEEGIARYSDVQVSAMVGGWEVKDLSGRTILPDGSSLPLRQENIFVKTLRHGNRLEQVKTAKFPGVVKGAIIEYSFDLLLPPYTFLTQVAWYPQTGLPVMDSKFSLKPGKLQYIWKQAGTEAVPISETSPFKNLKVYTATHVAPFPDEPFGPPEDAIRSRVYFNLPELQAAWLGLLAGRLSGRTGTFIEDSSGIAEKTAELTAPTDPPIEKVKKLYRFVQEKIGLEQNRAAENSQAGFKDATNAGEVLSRGFGNEYERTLLFVALVRQAGFDAGLLLVVGRGNSLFNDQVPDEDQFDAFAAAVNIGGSWNVYDPATKHCPFGMVSAEKEGAGYNAVQISPKKGADAKKPGKVQNLTLETYDTAPYRTLAIPFTSASRNILTREATLRPTPDGMLEVEGSERGTGHVDIEHRESYENIDEEARKTALAEELHNRVKLAELVSAAFENLKSFDTPAIIKYSVKVPGSISIVGDRLIITPAIWSHEKPNPFTAVTRRTPVWFRYASKTTDRIVIQVPDGFESGELPAPVMIKDPPFNFAMGFSLDSGTIVMNRRLEVDAAVFPVDSYSRLKSFFEKVQEADRQVVILQKKAK